MAVVYMGPKWASNRHDDNWFQGFINVCCTRSGNLSCAQTAMLTTTVQSSTNKVLCEEERAK